MSDVTAGYEGLSDLNVFVWKVLRSLFEKLLLDNSFELFELTSTV